MIWPSSGLGCRKRSGDFSGAYLTEARKDDRITSLAGSRLILAHAGRQPRGPHLSLERPPAARLLTKGDSMPSEEDIEVGRIFAELAEGNSVYAAVRTFLAAASNASPVEAVSRAITSPLLNLGALTSELVASTARNMAPDMPLSFGDAFDAYLATPQGRTMAAEAKKAADEARRAEVEWRARWRADYGMDSPEETADFIRAGVRAGLDANYLVGKQWLPVDILPVIEGYLLRLQDEQVAAGDDLPTAEATVDTQPALSKRAKPPAPANRKKRSEWQAQAAIMIHDNPESTDAEIAAKLGVHPSQLSRSKLYQAAKAIAKTPRQSLPTGQLDADGSLVDAWRDD
jgi:hypothetical protein